MESKIKVENRQDVLNCIVIMDLVVAEEYKESYDEFDKNLTKRNTIHDIY